MKKIKLRGGDEYDVHTNWRKVAHPPPSTVKQAKKTYRSEEAQCVCVCVCVCIVAGPFCDTRTVIQKGTNKSMDECMNA